MKLAVIKETFPGEARVAVTPDAVTRYKGIGIDIVIEKGAGLASSFTDAAYQEAGAELAADAASACASADGLLKVRGVQKGGKAVDETGLLAEGMLLIGMLDPLSGDDMITHYAKGGVTSFSMELMPRISRAQSMDVLSSQSNLAGYRAVIDAVAEFGKVVPMMMTAAGTVAPAKVLVLGAGVAGLQVIATAKRLGAVVSAFDVRPVVKEQVESLGAKFVEVEAPQADSETKGGYAKEMDDDYKRRQAEKIAEVIAKQDMIITTALIPGRPAPRLIDEAMVKSMKQGAVIVDMAAIAGGNCELTKADKKVEKHGVTILGPTNLPSQVAVDASQLYARNLFNFVSLLYDGEVKAWKLDAEDEIIRATMLTKGGDIVHPQFANSAEKVA